MTRRPAADLFDRVLEAFTSLERVVVDGDGRIVAANDAFARHVGEPAPGLEGQPLARFLADPDAALVAEWAAGAAVPAEPRLLNFVTSGHVPYTLRCVVGRDAERVVVVGEVAAEGREMMEELVRLNNELATLAREHARGKRELERAYWHLRKIQEVLPVCMECGQVKADGARWESVVDYLKSNDIALSHGYCPACYDAFVRAHDLEDEA